MSPTAISRRGEAPFLTHVVSHHGQLTLIPPQNAGRIRKTSPIRSTSTLNLRDLASSLSLPRRPRSPRAQSPTVRRAIDAQQDLTVPDFPPPSFQEALSTPIYGIPAVDSPSEVSLTTYHDSVVARSPSEISYPTTSASSTERSISIYQDAFDDDVADGDLSPSDSDSSRVEMVSLDASQTEWEEDRRQGLTLSERVRREKERLQMAEATWLRSPSVMSRQRTCSHCGASRTVDGDKLSIVAVPASSPTTDDSEETYQPVPGPATRKMFLFRHKHSQSMSSASVPSTPVSNRGQPSFQSLVPSDTGKRRSRSMSLSPRPSSPSSVVSSRPSLGFMSKRLFSHNSKGKERSSTSDEPLEAWEVLEAAPGSVDLPDQLPVSRLRRTLSKMSLATIGPMSSSVDSPKAIKPYPLQPTPIPQIPSEKQSPRKDLPPIQNRPVPPIPPALQTHPIRPPPPVPPPLRTHSPLATNVYSRSPPPPLALIMTPPSPEAEPPKKRRPPPPPPPPSRKSPSAATSVVERGRRQRCQSMSVHSTSPKMTFPPLSPIHDTVMSNFDGFRGHPFNASMLPTSPSYTPRSDSPSSASELSYVTDDRGTQLMSNSSSPSTILVQDRGTQGVEIVQQSSTSSVSPTSPKPLDHHFPGRPLPTPPSDSPISAVPISAASLVYGDEKAAVRLNSTSNEGQNVLPSLDLVFGVLSPRARTPIGEDTSYLREPTPVSLQINTTSPPLQSSISRSSLSVIEDSGLWQIRDAEDDDDDDYDDDYDERTTLSSEITELDVLMSRIEDSSPGQGGSYEDLLLVSEVLGRGAPSPVDFSQPHQGQSHTGTEKADTTPFVGRIEIRRRRVTRDGRVKLKLSLLGVKVDNCGICLSQFKDQEWAALGPRCQHSYHERCLKKWLMRNRACPLCRVPLDLEDNGV